MQVMVVNPYMQAAATPAPTLAFLQGATSTADATEYTFSGQSLGDAASDRLIVVCLHGRRIGTLPVSSVTVAGVTATEVVTQTNSSLFNGQSVFSRSAIYLASVPTGTSGDVVVTFGQTSLRCGIQLYRLTGVGATAASTATSIADAPTATLTIPANGLLIAAASTARDNAVNDCTWTNATRDYQILIESALRASSASTTQAGTDVAITATWPNFASSVGVFAVWA